MANTVYPKYKEALLSGSGPDLTAVNVKAVLVDTATYTYNAAHDFLDDVPAGARVGTSANLGSKTVTNGTFDCADYSITVGASQPSAEALIYYHDTGVEATSRLIVYEDTFTSGMPYTPPSGGGTVNITVNASGVFSL